MAAAGGNRRDFRRRLLQASPAEKPAISAASGQARQRTSSYTADALPERHPSFATRIPSKPLTLWAVSIAAVLVNALLALAVLEARPGRTLHTLSHRNASSQAAGRFDRSLAMLSGSFVAGSRLHDGASSGSALPSLPLAEWYGQTSLLAAAAVALAVRQMRRHRLDDFRGHYRAWGWLSGLLLVTAVSRQLPFGAIVAVLASDASGFQLGPGGIGWWVVAAIAAWLSVATWCLLPMQRRLTSAAWCCLGGLAWLAGTGVDLAIRAGTRMEDWTGLAAALAITAGDTSLAVGVLWAFRTVLREVRGEVPAASVTSAGEVAAAKDSRSEMSGYRGDSEDVEDGQEATPEADPSWNHRFEGASGYRSDDSHADRRDDASGDGDDEEGETTSFGHGGRKLSKAERRRLRKQARLDRAA